MTPFVYDKDIPVAILPEIKKAVELWAWAVPLWCERVFIGYSVDSHEDNLSANTAVEYPYRWARITFFPCFLLQADPQQDALHELIHIPLHVVGGWMRERIEALVTEESAPVFRKTLLDELKERIEAATEDLASRIAAHAKLKI